MVVQIRLALVLALVLVADTGLSRAWSSDIPGGGEGTLLAFASPACRVVLSGSACRLRQGERRQGGGHGGQEGKGGVQQLACTVKPSKVIKQRERIDAMLETLNDGGRLGAAHCEFVGDVKVLWDDVPKQLDPHWTTFRGVSLQSGIPATATIDALRANLNPRSIRKRAQVEGFYAALSLLSLPNGATVVDFGSGSGNLVLPLAHLLPNLDFVAVDLKQHATQVLTERAEAAGLKNCRAHTGYIEDFKEPFGVALGLHVCGPASNAVLDRAIGCDAAFLVSPCCIGKLNTGAQASIGGGEGWSYPMSRWMGASLDSEAYALIAGTADRSEVPPDGDYDGITDDEQAQHFRRGRMCKTAVEVDRLEWTKEKGYEPFLLRMRGLQDYSKKDLLVGIPPGWGKGRDSFVQGLREWSG